MGTLFKSASPKGSSIETKASEDPKRRFEATLDSLINSGIQSSVGSINPPVLASYVEGFPDLVKHSKNAPKNKEPQETLLEEAALEAEKSENSKENHDTAPRKKAVKTKAARGSQSPRRVTRTASIFQELASSKHDIKDFFSSLNWYESNKNYYVKRLQLVLDDFEPSESLDTGSGKQYYDYLLLDSRVSGLTEWPGFIRAVFYVGKGKNQRALDHTKEAAKIWMMGGEATSKKVSRILDIWRGEGEVIVLTAADGLVEYEALTREALVIEALGKRRLCNKNYGSFYGVATVLKARDKHELGATLLVKARERFIKDGADRMFAPLRLEKQLKSKDGEKSVFIPVRLEKQLECRNESAEDDEKIDTAVLTSLITENYSKAQRTKQI